VHSKVSKEIIPFQQEFPTYECDIKIIQLDNRSRSRTKKSDSDFQGCQESDSDSTQNYPIPYDSDSGSDSATLQWTMVYCFI